MTKLHFYPALSATQLVWPEQKLNLSLQSPALEFFTDFRTTDPMVIESTVQAVDVKSLMMKSHVRLKFVVDDDNQFLGIISLDELMDRRIVQKISEGYKRNDILVADMMRPKKDLRALDIVEVSRATIGEVIATLKDNGQQHCLVIERESGSIRGIFSASDISRKLHLPIDIQDKSSFYKVFAAIA